MANKIITKTAMKLEKATETKNKCYDLKVMIMDYYGGTDETSGAINTP